MNFYMFCFLCKFFEGVYRVMNEVLEVEMVMNEVMEMDMRPIMQDMVLEQDMEMELELCRWFRKRVSYGYRRQC